MIRMTTARLLPLSGPTTLYSSEIKKEIFTVFKKVLFFGSLMLVMISKLLVRWMQQENWCMSVPSMVGCSL